MQCPPNCNTLGTVTKYSVWSWWWCSGVLQVATVWECRYILSQFVTEWNVVSFEQIKVPRSVCNNLLLCKTSRPACLINFNNETFPRVLVACWCEHIELLHLWQFCFQILWTEHNNKLSNVLYVGWQWRHCVYCSCHRHLFLGLGVVCCISVTS